MKDKSFSELSRKIIKKYSRAPWDKYERKERDAELDKLVEKQEEVRNELGLNDMQNPDTGYKHGGKMKYETGGDLPNYVIDWNKTDPTASYGDYTNIIGNIITNAKNSPRYNIDALDEGNIMNNPHVTPNSVGNSQDNYGKFRPADNWPKRHVYTDGTYSDNYRPKRQLDFGQNDLNNVVDSSTLAPMTSTISKNANNVSYEPYQTSVLPSVFSYGTNLLGNLALSGLDQPRTVEGSYYTPQNVSYANERNVIQDQNTLARNILNRRLRGAGLSKGAYTAGLTSGSTGLDRNLAAQLGQSYQNEGNINAQLTNQARRYNAGERSRVNQLNESMEQARRQRQRDYLASIIGGGSGLSRDITATRQQDDLVSMLGRDYKIVRDPQTGRKVIQYIGR